MVSPRAHDSRDVANVDDVDRANVMELPSAVFARRLRDERSRRRVTQADLAETLTRVGVTMTQSAIARIESQERAVRLDEAFMCADALGIPLTALLIDDDPSRMLAGELAALEQTLADARRQVTQIIGLTTTI